MGRLKDKDFVEDVKLSAGHIARRCSEEGWKYVPEGQTKTEIMMNPITEYYIFCKSDACEFRVKKVNLCSYVTGRCMMAENLPNFPGKETRYILKLED